MARNNVKSFLTKARVAIELATLEIKESKTIDLKTAYLILNLMTEVEPLF